MFGPSQTEVWSPLPNHPPEKPTKKTTNFRRMASNLVATSPAAGVPWRSRNVFLMQIASAKIFQSHNFYFRYSSFKIVLHTCWRIALVSAPARALPAPFGKFALLIWPNEGEPSVCQVVCLETGDQRPETGARRLFSFRCCHFPRQSPIHKEGRPEWAGP